MKKKAYLESVYLRTRRPWQNGHWRTSLHGRKAEMRGSKEIKQTGSFDSTWEHWPFSTLKVAGFLLRRNFQAGRRRVPTQDYIHTVNWNSKTQKIVKPGLPQLSWFPWPMVFSLAEHIGQCVSWSLHTWSWSREQECWGIYKRRQGTPQDQWYTVRWYAQRSPICSFLP